MATYIALLRGINVGTAKRVAMADLRGFFKSFGYSDVKTLLNSGNVVFSGTKPSEEKIEKAFTERFGFSSRMTIIGAAELAKIVEENPITEIPDPARFLVAFLKTPGHRELLVPIAKADWGSNTLALGKRVAYLWCAEGILDSKMNQAVSKVLKDSLTARNWSTVLKLLDLTR